MAKRKKQKDKQQSTKHSHKTKELRNPTENRGQSRCSGRVFSYCSTSGNRCVNLVTHRVISHE